MRSSFRSAEHRVQVSHERVEDGTLVVKLALETHDGPCPGHLVLRTERLPDQADEASKLLAHIEHLAYVLAKQIEAVGLSGVSDHVQGHWLLWQGSH